MHAVSEANLMVLQEYLANQTIDAESPKGSCGDFRVLKRVLDAKVYADHKVKERLLEHFAIKHLSNAPGKTILCLLAPPGMGKASIVKTLCSGLSWRLIVIPIGEMTNDDGALAGNRRADINATAGRIIQSLNGMKACETVVLLENIDKTDLSGLSNSSAGFFEVLNYMYDYSLRNNYLTQEIDFSQVYFIATASNLSTIPQGLREEMDLVTIPSYSEQDKRKIARDYIVPKLLDEYALRDRLLISDNALISIIRKYTREAGVSELERNLITICQSALKKIMERRTGGRINIYNKSLPSYLGPPKFFIHSAGERDEVGVIRILGRSDRGGCVLTLESLIAKGEGKLVFTGNLDKTFQESALVAIDYIRSRYKKFGVEADFHKKYDIHLHVPEATTPKYGVSAGMAIVTALVSSLTGRPVRRDVGMTGEVSLHGKVLGVRDIRDKVLGAHQAGIRTVFLPKENEADLKHIPREIRKVIKFFPLENVDIAVEEALLRI